MNYFKLGEVAGKAWRLGHMGEGRKEQEEAKASAWRKLGIRPELFGSFDRGWDAGVLAVDENAAQVHQTEPFNGAAHAPDGAVVSLHIDPEREHRYVVVLVHTSADVYVCWATETEQQARSLFEALQHARVLEVE